MKWFILIFLAILLIPHGAQFKTRLRPMWPAEPRHYGIALAMPKTIIRFEIVRLA